MNTPRSKPPTRYTYTPSKHDHPDGAYTSGIYNDDFASVVGQLITYWPHVEEQMIQVFGELLGIEDPILQRQVFRSIIAQNQRITLMRTMLEKSPVHVKTGQFYDEVIDEFAGLNKSRNIYAHSRWYTKDDDKRVFIQEQIADPFGFSDSREVLMSELEQVAARMGKLVQKIVQYYFVRRRAANVGPTVRTYKGPDG